MAAVGAEAEFRLLQLLIAAYDPFLPSDILLEYSSPSRFENQNADDRPMD